MEGDLGESGSDYFDCVTDRSRSSSEELEERFGTKKEAEGFSSGDWRGEGEGEGHRTPTVRRFRRINNKRRQLENAMTEKKLTVGDPEVNLTQMGDGYDICGYEVQAPPRSNYALKRLSADAAAVYRKEDEKHHSVRSKVQEEVMKLLFGPPDAKTPDEEKYEVVQEQDVTRGVSRTGILFRFSMWATFGFISWVLGGRRARIGCTELLPNVRERDPVPKVIVKKKTY